MAGQSVNSWKTLADLSDSFTKQKLVNQEQEMKLNLDQVINLSSELLDVQYGKTQTKGQKLIGILKNSENSEKDTEKNQELKFGMMSLKSGLKLEELEDDLDEGLGDLDDVFDDFDEVYEATMNGGYGSYELESCDRKSTCYSETDSSGVSECDIESPMSDLSADSPFKFKSHNDSVSLYEGASSPSAETRDCFCGLRDSEFSCSRCNKDRNNDSDVTRTWMTDFSCDNLSSQGCLKQSTVNNHGDNKTTSSSPKTKSVHFAIFPYVIEIPRVSDLELEFDRSSNIGKHERLDENLSHGNYDI